MADRTTTLRGACVVEGGVDAVEGEAMVCDANLAFALVDPRTGVVKQPGHPWLDRSIAGKVIVYPTGQGSSSGSWWLLNLAHEGCAPAAIVNAQSDVVVIAGAVLAGIPLLHRLSPDPFACIQSGDRVRVVAREGTVQVVAAGSSR
ncbi:MAG: DUF126 domain-containing protein [Burkholderiales bacterium]